MASAEEGIRKIFEGEDLKSKGYFTDSDVSADLAAIDQIGKRRAASEKFRAEFEMPVDHELISEALASKAKVFIYRKNKKVRAVYIVRKNASCVSCNEIMVSPSLPESIKEQMDRYFTYYVAKTAKNYSIPNAEFAGKAVPKLLTKTKFDLGLFLIWTMAFGCPLWLCLSNPAYSSCGLPMAICLAFKTYYKYEETSAEENVTP